MKLRILHLTCVASFAATSGLVAQSPESLQRAEEASIPEEAGASPAKTSPAAEAPARKPAEMVDDEVLVAFKPGAPAADRESARQTIGAGKIKEFARIGVQHWKLPPGLTVARALELLSKNPNLRFAEPNYIVRKSDLGVPGDEFRGDLWGMHNVGQNGGTPDADIDALEAWVDASVQGTGQVVVGVIDSGIDYTHPDLRGRFLPGTVDGVPLGYDFVNNDADAMDDHGHGTHVAGTIAANADDGLGVIGVAGRNTNVKLVPIKFLSASGSGTTDAAISAILYAADLDIKITNNSWGGGERSAALELAIQDSGALFVAAAGNNRSSSLHYPAGYNLPNVVAVAATDAHDGLAYFSNFGDWVHLGAPGASIVSTTPNDTYSRYNGTSMAAPHVAGAAALVLSLEPGSTIAALKTRLLTTGDSIASLANGRTSSGKRLNVAAALGAAELNLADGTPAAVLNLVAHEPTQTSLLLEWDHVVDEVAYVYDLRYRISGTITPENWSAATPVYGEPAPPSDGSVLVQGLEPGITYHFALRVLSANGTAFGLVTTQGSTLPLGWKSSVVDASSSVGDYRSMAFNSSGQPFIAYSDRTNNRVKVATRSSENSPWVMDTFGSGYGGVSLALIPEPATTGASRPSVSWAAGKLYFATKATGVWAISTLEKSGVQGDTTSLAYAPDGTPAISYRSTSSSGGLKIAWRTGTTWRTQVVAPGAAARYSSLAFGPNGNPMIAYSDDPNGDNTLDALKLAVGTNRTSTGWTWTIETLRQGVAGYGVWAAIAVDSIGNPYILHREFGIIRLLRRNSGTDWVAKDLGAGSNFNLTIGTDGSGKERAYVAYSSGGKARLASAVLLEPASEWELSIFDVEGFNWTPSVKVTAGVPHVAYGIGGTLRMATEAPGHPGPAFVFVDDMESGENGWNPEGNRNDPTAKTKPPEPSNEPGLWHQTIRRGTDPGHSPVTSWYYGIENQGNYDTGTRNWGRLISPAIALTGSAAELKVSQLALAEGARYENAEIQIREVGGSTWTTVFQRASRTNTSFITDRINLSQYLGKNIQIGFFLDTKDGNYNQFEGWYVDDVSVKLWP